MIHELHELLSRAGARLRSLRLWTSLAVCWLFWATVAYAVARFAAANVRNWPAVWGILLGASFFTALLCWLVARRAGRDPQAIARRIEATHPELGAMLLAALEQAPAPRFKRLGYLQSAVVRGAVSHGRQHDWGDMTSRGRLRLAKTAHLAALAALVSSCVMLAGKTSARGSAGSSAGSNDEILLGADFKVEVQPGNAEVERGSTLLVIAKFAGALPPDADLIVRREQTTPVKGAADDQSATDKDEDRRSSRRMTRSLDDPQFVGRVPAVSVPFTYHVEFAGQRSPTYRITVFEYPELERADAHLKYPDYTRLEDKVVEDVRQVTAVEGTQLTLQFRLNKDVADARLVDRDNEERSLVRVPGADPVYEVSYRLERSQRFKLHLVDREQRKNKLPPDIVVNVTPNQPPTIKLTKPGRDVRVSPVEELQLAGELRDDFGVSAYGLGYALGGEEPKDVALGAPTSTDAKPIKTAALMHLIDFESLNAEPDQLVSYYVWVEDVGPDGKPRRTLSDMYFAEVRHFDEVFREGEQPTEQQQREQQQQQQQGQQGAGQQAEELAELQKQVVSATWKLIRRETAAEPTAEFGEDIAAVQAGQQQAVEKLGELAGQVQDQQSREYAEQAQQQMDSVLESLSKAADGPDLKALRPALSAEQAAYQSLLKLRAREFNVSRQQAGQQQAGSASGSGSASQQQLQQLELSNQENRYETQSRANAAQQESAGQLDESRQILNRLRELARRQQDLNERLRELQASLEQAETPQEREELERQLKRLRDQQREILRDAESLDNDMQNSENRDQLQEASGELSETRSRVQQASESLEQGQVSQALTEGARAEQQLTDLRDAFRRRTADRFTEEMRELRDSAQRMDERQQQLGEQLQQMNGGQRTLRDTGAREELQQGLQQQQQELTKALDQMRETVTEAEEPEPLLARQLYDAVQQAGQQRTEESLDVARRLTEAGASNEASEAMQQAGRGVQQLRENIERAAESVLGDETEALRRADERLRDLAEALNREIQNGQGGEPQPGQQQGQASQRGEGQGGQESQPSQQGQPGQQGQGQQPGAGQQPGEGQPGSQQQGQQPGQGQQGQGDQNQSQSPGEGQQPGEGGNQSGEQQGRGGSQGNQPGQRGEGQQSSDAEREDQQRNDNSGQGEGQSGQQDQQGENAQRPGQGQGGQQEGNQQQSSNGRGGRGGNQPGDADEQEQNSNAAEGEPQERDAAEGNRGDGQGQQQGGPSRGGSQRGGAGGPGDLRGGLERLGEFRDAFESGREYRGPITGDNFRDWSSGMREVEDMLDDPELSAEAARIRDRTEAARVDYVRHSQTPDWGQLQEMVAEPLAELRRRIADEIRRKESPDSLVPIDRDAAPPEFAEEVRQYYQRLGSGE